MATNECYRYFCVIFFQQEHINLLLKLLKYVHRVQYLVKMYL